MSVMIVVDTYGEKKGEKKKRKKEKKIELSLSALICFMCVPYLSCTLQPNKQYWINEKLHL